MVKRKQFLSDFDGVLQCARYAFMPNRLAFCGPDKNKDLFEYCARKEADEGLHLILKDFATLYPYLRFIARVNHVRDPFDKKIVEAYWIGNDFLENTSQAQVYYHLTENLKLKKKVGLKKFREIEKNIRPEAKPHHSFHVFNVWQQKKHLNELEVVRSMDLCRISWGKIKGINKLDLDVEYRPLILEENRLKLSEPVVHKVLYKINDKTFADNLKIGDWVSSHWSFVCEPLDEKQVEQLEKYTKESINLVNNTR